MLPDIPSSMPSFVPRHFPPPALADVPVDYIIHKLHQLAPNYWDRPRYCETVPSASTSLIIPLLLLIFVLVVPIPHPVGRARRAPDMPLFTSGITTPRSPSPRDPSGLSRRATDPVLTPVPRVTFEVHCSSLPSVYTMVLI